MRKHWSRELENLKVITKVVYDEHSYHARTPANDAWCGRAPAPPGWKLMSLLQAEEEDMFPCTTCFGLPDNLDTIQGRLPYDT